MTVLFDWRKAIPESPLSSQARLLAWTLSGHMDQHGGSCYPSIDTLVAETAMSRRTVQRAVVELIDAKLIVTTERKGGRGVSTRYQAVIPDPKGATETAYEGRPSDERAPGTTEKGATDDCKQRQAGARGSHEDAKRSSSSADDVVHRAASLHARRALRKTPTVVTDAGAYCRVSAANWLEDFADEIERYRGRTTDAEELIRLVERGEQPKARRERATETRCEPCDGTSWVDAGPGLVEPCAACSSSERASA